MSCTPLPQDLSAQMQVYLSRRHVVEHLLEAVFTKRFEKSVIELVLFRTSFIRSRMSIMPVAYSQFSRSSLGTSSLRL